MRFGLTLDHRDWARGAPAQATIELAELADAAGFDSLWVIEDPDGWDAFGLLGAISQRTSRIQLGTGVTNPYLRHPNLIAASIATLDRLAPGRAFLGLGRGQPEWYERSLGMEIGKPLARLEETISLLRQWWSADQTASGGDELPVRDWKRVIGPTTPPPIYLAAAGPRALDLAGRVSDGVLFNMLATPVYLEGAIERVRVAAALAGRDPNALQFIANPGIVVTNDPEPVLRERKRFVANVLTLPGMDVLLEIPEIDVPAIMQRVRTHMKTDQILAAGGAFAAFAEQGDVAAAVAEIPDALVEPGSAVGSLQTVRARIQEFAELGVTEVMVARNGLPTTPTKAAALLEALRA
jgi:5,10-methylenetetrahydromethanopterin reductase